MLTKEVFEVLKAGQAVLDNYEQEWQVVGEWPILGASLGWRYRILEPGAPFRLLRPAITPGED